VWFGLIDTLGIGESRCSSCGVEGYVIAAHAVAALWLGAVVAWLSALRRRLDGEAAVPGRRTLAGLAVAALLLVVALLWHEASEFPLIGAVALSLLGLPVAAVWWLIGTVALWRRSAVPEAEQRRRVTGELVAAWLALTVLLPGIYGWVWLSRVQWLVF
jgi:hypothetical protein